ncbi:spore coat protein CotF [Paenibacillus pabuli]|uniref:Spore coat protein CotF n=2 Tax=Paenibacillus TaxID=44249 RepID=A0ABX9BFS1_9BACL|nr:spore coat protein CotF [Paenibacillus pabuli]SEN95960.1 Spore coat protein CotF [Paenibacillus sp. OK076]
MNPNSMQPPNRIQPATNANPGFTPQMNHGGHEMFDMHEILSGAINVLDQYMIFRTFVQDNELLGILDRQYNFMLSQYNLTAECFSTGHKPQQETATYMIPNIVPPVYGLKPSAPKKPNQSLSDVKDAGISGHMLGLIKSHASLLAMSAPEITNGAVRRVIASQVQQFIEMAYEIFMYQNQHAYYQVPQLNANDTTQMLQAYVPANGTPQMPINNKPPLH